VKQVLGLLQFPRRWRLQLVLEIGTSTHQKVRGAGAVLVSYACH